MSGADGDEKMGRVFNLGYLVPFMSFDLPGYGLFFLMLVI